MPKYLVKISEPKYRENLVNKFHKVGKPESLPNFLIVETVQPMREILNCPGVVSVEPDGIAKAERAVDQPAAPGWGLPWISNSGGNYANERSGEKVDIYVIDTGVRDTHADFGGRVRTLYSFDGVPYSTVGGQSPTHGTSVAGCAAGALHGTAKDATIVNCRIDFMHSTILKAIDKTLRDHLDKEDDRPSVVNFSGTSISPIIGDAFKRLVDYGAVVVAAAGNDSEPTPRYPAANIWIMAIGAINQGEGPAWFTNRTCDVYAPGQDVQAPSVFSDTSVNVVSGTSFASPYYAGVLACLLEGSDKFNTAGLVDNFTFQMRNQLMEQGRIPNFPNGSYPVRTITTNGLGGNYYVAPSRQYTDAEIREYLLANAGNPQLIADGCLAGNLSRARLARIADSGIEDIDQYFINAGVTPWWFV